MTIIETHIQDLLVIEPRVFIDDRGYFFESYNSKTWPDGITTREFVQDNEAYSSYGVVRGLHYQIPPYAQAKLVRVVLGSVLDVVVDIRPGSPTYGQSHCEILSADNKKQMYVPRGFAHGYAVLSETAIFSYKCDNFYSKEHEGGILYNDESLAIDWMVPVERMELSEKDRNQPRFGRHREFRSS